MGSAKNAQESRRRAKASLDMRVSCVLLMGACCRTNANMSRASHNVVIIILLIPHRKLSGPRWYGFRLGPAIFRDPCPSWHAGAGGTGVRRHTTHREQTPCEP